MILNGFQLLQCGLSVAALLGGSALAASPAVYPVPQQSKLSSQTVAFSGKPSVVIRSAKTAASKLLNGVPEKSGAYKLVVSPQGKVPMTSGALFTPCRRCGSSARRPAAKA